MAKKGGPSIKGMHIAFGIASVMLLLTTIYAFLQDHTRAFTSYQDRYEESELQRLGNEKKQAQALLELADVKAEYAKLEKMMADAETKKSAKQADIDNEIKVLGTIADTLQKAERDFNSLKGDLDVLKYEFGAGIRSLKEWKDQQVLVDKKFVEVDELRHRKDSAQSHINKIENDFKNAEKELNKILAAQADVNEKIKKTAGNPVINFIKDAPGIDFIQPRRHIDQVVLTNLPVSVFFANTQRVDRCVTCHQGIDNPDPMYRDKSKVETALLSHPRLDLFVGANSKHPYKKFGCTVCHQGRGMGVEFARAAHSPQNPEQAEKWEHDYKWEPNEFWDQKMLPLQHTEASCMKCHRGLDNVPEASKLNEGRHLFRDRGCTNCHMGATGDKDMAWVGRVGPDLRRIGEKTNIEWTRNWIENPWDFRPSTKMPRFFGLENRRESDAKNSPPLSLALQDGSHVIRDPVEVEAISTYLFTTSKLREKMPAKPPEGDVAAGKKLFELIGCLGCHSTHESKDNKYELNEHGPDLSRIGEKTDPGWLFEWLKNPRHYWPETKMPDLRLSDKEAADLTGFLMKTMKSEHPHQKLDSAPEAAFDAIIFEKLGATMPKARIEELLKDSAGLLKYSSQNKSSVGLNSLTMKVKYVTAADGTKKDSGDGEWTEEQIKSIQSILNEMPDKKRAVKAFYAGEVLIQHNGCFGCHNIQGWTYAPLTCVSLIGESDKDISKFDFGMGLANTHAPYAHENSIPYTKWDWFYTKIARPRVFDMGKLDLIKPFDRLRMPWFGNSKNETAHGESASKEHAAHETGPYHPDKNEDVSTPHGLKHEQIDRLVTHLLSLTMELVPDEMKHHPSPQEVAIDRGHRVVRELNCAGCHLVGLAQGPQKNGVTLPHRLPLESFVALLSAAGPKAKQYVEIPSNRIYFDEDIAHLDYQEKQTQNGVGDDASALEGFLNIMRGTYVTPVTVPIAMSEKQVRSDPLDPFIPIAFTIDSKKKNADWIEYGSLVSLKRFKELTSVFYGDEASANESYDKLKQQFVDKNAYERLAGTEMLHKAGVLTFTETENRRTQKKFYEPVSVKVRFSRGEGRLISHIIETEQKNAEDEDRTLNASPQLAPPSLSYEGGKVQPDWLYQFLHRVTTLRTGLNVRMPSFWTSGPFSDYKVIYPTGHLSAVDPFKRHRGVAGEPMPASDALSVGDVADDAAQIVDFFIQDAAQKPYGYQPLPIVTASDFKLYNEGLRLLLPDSPENKGGFGCTNCHALGKREPKEPKWAPNLVDAKRRLNSEWVRRFLTFPPSIYPWTNMPNNFGFGWDGYNHDQNDALRGMFGSKEADFKASADKLRAVHFYLMHSGDGDVGVDPSSSGK